MKILLIDDDDKFCEETQEYLESKSLRVTTETDGYKAIPALDRVDPDIVILDIALQKDDINGLNICTEIRQHTKYQKGALGIIMISGHHSKYKNWTRGLQHGADRYLVKPFELDILIEEIRSLHSLIDGVVTLTVDEHLTIYFSEHRVAVNGQNIHLTRREFDVLSYLAKPPNKTRTRYELLENVWKAQDYSDGAIARCIHTLRHKISPDDLEFYIQSVRGVGYRLRAERTR